MPLKHNKGFIYPNKYSSQLFRIFLLLRPQFKNLGKSVLSLARGEKTQYKQLTIKSPTNCDDHGYYDEENRQDGHFRPKLFYRFLQV